MKSFQLFILFLFIIPSLSFAQSTDRTYIPQEGRLLIIGQQKDAIDGYIKNIGTVPGGLMFYTSIQNLDGLDSPATHGAGIMDAQYYVNSYPHVAIQLALYMVGGIEDTLAGKYDDNILKLARWMENTDCPIYFRIGYEFDLPANRYAPEQYIQVYHYIVDHLRALGVHNVSYVWHSACQTESLGNFMAWYPGDDYVDWFAVSLFDPMQISVAKQFFALAQEHQKQFMIAESAPAGNVSTRAKSEWFRHYFDFIHEYDVKVVCYINSNWNSYPLFKAQDWGDSRIEKDPVIKDLWLNETNHGYLQYSLDMFKKLTPS